MSNYRPKYQSVNRTELNVLIDKLVETRNEIRKVYRTPVSKISNEKKYFVLQDLDEIESYYAQEIARAKGILTPSIN